MLEGERLADGYAVLMYRYLFSIDLSLLQSHAVDLDLNQFVGKSKFSFWLPNYAKLGKPIAGRLAKKASSTLHKAELVGFSQKRECKGG